METLKWSKALCLVFLMVFIACKKTPVYHHPVANAGVDLGIVLPANQVQLVGSGKDADGNIIKFEWSRLMTDQTPATLLTPDNASTEVTDLVHGTYLFQLKVTDNNGLSATDVVIVSVYDTSDDPCAGCWDY